MGNSQRRELDDSLLDRIRAVVVPGDEIYTLTSKRPNRIVSIERVGIEVETIRSEDRGTGPQLVPAWMIDTAWAHLRRHGRLTQDELLSSLNVKRSAFVCALLAQFNDVSVISSRPTVLELVREE
ncbi:Uncharacterised protein [Mycolicibacterium vanbaalenii]|uniref:Uncharacterized protein n=1 Tax=Mycolicibacterium vanbaalenii TaxID=110539 RepID=A0A5S9RC34_MYCVN|nr:hypothetical protein [Mycolicibacterium vanbaalenii]CAA0138208.1 Uncharacterised protein [Mycolicibacterium vanbaalenii]